MARRPKGTGSITKIADNKYQIRACLGYDSITKKYRRVKETIIGTKKDAEARLREILRLKDLGNVLAKSNMTVEELLNEWLHSKSLAKKTYVRYEGIIRNHIVPVIGSIPVAKLTTNNIQQLVNAKKELQSPESIHKMYTILHSALEYAKENLKIITTNPAKNVTKPPVKPVRSQGRPLTEDEVRRFLEAAKGNRFYALFALAIATGLRPEEFLGLKWRNVDLKRKRITITEAVVFVKGKPEDKDELKTDSAYRTIAIGDELVRILQEHKIQQEEHKRRMGELYEDHDLVFPSEKGTYMDIDNLRKRYFKPILIKAGLPTSIRMYDLRHTNATYVVRKGHDLKILSKRLGHKNEEFTWQRYHHYTVSKEEEEIAAALDDLLRP